MRWRRCLPRSGWFEPSAAEGTSAASGPPSDPSIAQAYRLYTADLQSCEEKSAARRSRTVLVSQRRCVCRARPMESVRRICSGPGRATGESFFFRVGVAGVQAAQSCDVAPSPRTREVRHGICLFAAGSAQPQSRRCSSSATVCLLPGLPPDPGDGRVACLPGEDSRQSRRALRWPVRPP